MPLPQFYTALATGGNIFLDQQPDPEKRETDQQHHREYCPASARYFALSQWRKICVAKRASKGLLQGREYRYRRAVISVWLLRLRLWLWLRLGPRRQINCGPARAAEPVGHRVPRSAGWTGLAIGKRHLYKSGLRRMENSATDHQTTRIF